MDLPDICSRSELHIKSNDNVLIFRLSSEAKTTMFYWVASEVKFPDGYVSNMSRCVEQGQNFVREKEFLEDMMMEEYRHHMQLMVFLIFSVKLDGLVVN